jgi:hypothetical protein
VYQLYKESEVLKKLKDKMGDVGKIQEAFVNAYKKFQKSEGQAEQALSEFTVPVSMSELVPESDKKTILEEQSKHIQSVIQGDMPDQSKKSPAHQAYFTREQLHQEEHRLKEEQQKRAEIQKKSIKVTSKKLQNE